jgi:tetratricopeptide (TPR) repeat protein
LSSEAVELARRTGNSAALAYALAGRAHAITAPDTVAEFLALGTELCEVATRSGDRERMQAGHQIRIVAQLMLGDVRGAEADLVAASRIADELRQPAQLWDACAAQAMLALAEGRLAEAEALIPRALMLGERALPEAADPIYRLQRYTLCLFRGNLEEMGPLIAPLAAEYPARPVFRCALAHLHASLGREENARRELDLLIANGASVLPFDQEWLFGMSLLAETSAILRHTEHAAVLYEALVPWAGFAAVDVTEGFRGSVARYLGLLATMLGRPDDAVRHFEDALAMNERMGARPWLAFTQEDYARMLLARDGPGDSVRARELIEQAVATYGDLGMDSYAARASALVGETAVSTR